MYVSDEAAVREHLATLRGHIEKERASTIDRCTRLRRFVRDDAELRARERDEWNHFGWRIKPLQQEIDVITGLLAEKAGLEAPPPVIVVKSSL